MAACRERAQNAWAHGPALAPDGAAILIYVHQAAPVGRCARHGENGTLSAGALPDRPVRQGPDCRTLLERLRRQGFTAWAADLTSHGQPAQSSPSALSSEPLRAQIALPRRHGLPGRKPEPPRPQQRDTTRQPEHSLGPSASRAIHSNRSRVRCAAWGGRPLQRQRPGGGGSPRRPASPRPPTPNCSAPWRTLARPAACRPSSPRS